MTTSEILLDASAFSQVAQDRPLIWRLFWRRSAVRSDHGDAQLAGQTLSAREIDDTSCTRLSSLDCDHASAAGSR